MTELEEWANNFGITDPVDIKNFELGFQLAKLKIITELQKGTMTTVLQRIEEMGNKKVKE